MKIGTEVKVKAGVKLGAIEIPQVSGKVVGLGRPVMIPGDNPQDDPRVINDGILVEFTSNPNVLFVFLESELDLQ